MLRTILILTVISLTTGVFASNSNVKAIDKASAGQITGNVMSLNTQNALPLAQIVIYSEESEVIKVTTTDQKGNFVIPDLPEGKYFLSISYLGYKTVIVDDIVICATHMPVNVKNLLLECTTFDIDEVIVKAERKDNQLFTATNN